MVVWTVIRSDDPEKLKVGDVLLSWNGQGFPIFLPFPSLTRIIS